MPNGKGYSGASHNQDERILYESLPIKVVAPYLPSIHVWESLARETDNPSMNEIQ